MDRKRQSINAWRQYSRVGCNFCPLRPRACAAFLERRRSTFLHNHAAEIWACDFLPVPDLFFRSLFAFFIIELKSRKVLHVGVTRHPTDAWVAEPLREAGPLGKRLAS